MRKQLPKYPTVAEALALIPKGFTSDGLSGGFPDWMFQRWNLTEIDWPHAHRYCQRCWPAGALHPRAQKWADRQLNAHANERLPWWLKIVPFILLGGVRAGGHGSFDTCYANHPDGATAAQRREGLCRHSMPMKAWMQRLAELDGK